MSRAGSAIDTSDLTKVYGKHLTAVDRLNLSVRRGEVYGFLGPNGAGKTTTLRMLLGLVRATSGTARVLGEAPGYSENLARVGAMVEEPALYPYLSGRDNLRVIARYVGRPDDGIDAALDAVGLLQRGGDRFNAYSQGMRQRLGVAAALLKDPELLILDEPTNGLDPAGMADMRTLIRTLGSGDRTVLLSSHLLGEVQQVCDRVGVISNGALIAEGQVDELRAGDRSSFAPSRWPPPGSASSGSWERAMSRCLMEPFGSTPTRPTPRASTATWCSRVSR